MWLSDAGLRLLDGVVGVCGTRISPPAGCAGGLSLAGGLGDGLFDAADGGVMVGDVDAGRLVAMPDRVAALLCVGELRGRCRGVGGGETAVAVDAVHGAADFEPDDPAAGSGLPFRECDGEFDESLCGGVEAVDVTGQVGHA